MVACACTIVGAWVLGGSEFRVIRVAGLHVGNHVLLLLLLITFIRVRVVFVLTCVQFERFLSLEYVNIK